MIETLLTGVCAVFAVVLLWLVGLFIIDPQSFLWRLKRNK